MSIILNLLMGCFCVTKGPRSGSGGGGGVRIPLPHLRDPQTPLRGKQRFSIQLKDLPFIKTNPVSTPIMRFAIESNNFWKLISTLIDDCMHH